MASVSASLQRIEAACSRPVDAAWLIAFRVLFGVALAVSMLRFIAYGWIDRLLLAPSFRFTYWGFGWVEPLPAPLMHALFWVLVACALGIAAGFLFRVTAPLFALGLTYVQLIDVSTYLNHYYLAALLAWLLAVSPAARAGSLDALLSARLRPNRPKAPAQLSAAWLYLFRFQVGLVYVGAGLAKFGPDWLLHGQPLRIWLGASAELPLLGPWLARDGLALAMSWAGFLFDTTIVLWLSWRRTRPFAYLLVLTFHALTRVFFPIGMFPVIMSLAALVFFEPHWPRRVRVWVMMGAARWRAPRAKADEVAARNLALSHASPTTVESSPPRRATALLTRGAYALGVAYVLCQVALPFRYLAYGGNVLWHEQGMRFSWRVMVRAKGGQTTFLVRNVHTGREWHVSPRAYLTGLQESEMSSQPDLIVQLAQHIAQDFTARGYGPVEVRAETRVSLNGRRSAPLLDPAVDLSRVSVGLGSAPWILPAPTEPPPRTRPVL
jgi:hypothetical protein